MADDVETLNQVHDLLTEASYLIQTVEGEPAGRILLQILEAGWDVRRLRNSMTPVARDA